MPGGEPCDQRYPERFERSREYLLPSHTVRARRALREVAENDANNALQVATHSKGGEHAIEAVRTLRHILEKKNRASWKPEPSGSRTRMKEREVAMAELDARIANANLAKANAEMQLSGGVPGAAPPSVNARSPGGDGGGMVSPPIPQENNVPQEAMAV